MATCVHTVTMTIDTSCIHHDMAAAVVQMHARFDKPTQSNAYHCAGSEPTGGGLLLQSCCLVACGQSLPMNRLCPWGGGKGGGGGAGVSLLLGDNACDG